MQNDPSSSSNYFYIANTGSPTVAVTLVKHRNASSGATFLIMLLRILVVIFRPLDHCHHHPHRRHEGIIPQERVPLLDRGTTLLLGKD
jgi:hypothetical protein